MAFDMTPTAKPALMTAAAALALYEAASPNNPVSMANAADALAAVVRANLRKLQPSEAKVKTGFVAEMKAALAVAGKVTTRYTIPIVGHTVLDARGDTLVLTTTDLDIWVSTTVQAPGIGIWRATAPTKALKDAFSSAKGEALVSPAPDGTDVDILVNGTTMRLKGLDPDEAPELKLGAPRSMTMDLGALVAATTFTRPAVSTEETRYYLNGTYWHPTTDGSDRVLRLVSTDGHRLMVRNLPMDWPSDWKPAIFPRKASDVLMFAAKGMTGDIVIDQDDMGQTPAFTLRFGPHVIRTKTIDGAYPDYCRVIPQGSAKHTFTASSAELTSAINQVKKAGSDYKSPFFTFETEDGAANLFSRGLEGQRAEARIRAPLAVPGAEITFQATYVLEALEVLDCETVIVAFGDESGPARIVNADHWNPSGGASFDNVCVVMPKRR